MLRSKRVVFPEPGELMRFTAKISRPWSQPRFRSARRRFFPRISCSSWTVREVVESGPVSAGVSRTS
jgi:hypothetical protein